MFFDDAAFHFYRQTGLKDLPNSSPNQKMALYFKCACARRLVCTRLSCALHLSFHRCVAGIVTSDHYGAFKVGNEEKETQLPKTKPIMKNIAKELS